jgi:hypothetical protein
VDGEHDKPAPRELRYKTDDALIDQLSAGLYGELFPASSGEAEDADE